MNWGHPERRKLLLLAGDFVLAGSSSIFTAISHGGASANLPRRAAVFIIFILAYTVCFYVLDLYDVQGLNGPRTVTRLVSAAFAGTCVFSFAMYVFQWPEVHRTSLGLAVLFLVATSFLWRRFYKRHYRVLLKRRGVLLVGSKEDASNLRAILESEHSRYDFLGFLPLQAFAATSFAETVPEDQSPLFAAVAAGAMYESRGGIAVMRPQNLPRAINAARLQAESGPQNIGAATPAMLENLALRLDLDTIVMPQNLGVSEFAESLTRLRFQGIRISTMPDLCSQVLEEIPLETLTDAWLSFTAGFNLLHERAFRTVKRLMDIALACVGLIVTLPISILVAIAIKLDSPGPILFRQWRVGWKDKPFTLLKFRSMRQDAESDGKAQSATAMDPRATRLGRILRRLHIDEFPQMINVLLGEMSFVGPRPERPFFVEQLKQRVPFYSLRHHVPPGITGWAQVNYPYGASVEDAKRKLQFDLFYVRHASPTLDIRILLRTIRVVLFRRGSR
jgi:lipopolysaccharide/colanic/teichoic acid biosynthesis glycosyltransferase